MELNREQKAKEELKSSHSKSMQEYEMNMIYKEMLDIKKWCCLPLAMDEQDIGNMFPLADIHRKALALIL